MRNVYLAPNELKQAGEDIRAISETLAQILDKDAESIAKKAADRSMRYQQNRLRSSTSSSSSDNQGPSVEGTDLEFEDFE